MRILFPLGPVFLPVGRLKNKKNVGPFLGPHFENIRVVQQIGSRTKMWDVGCDRMVFTINSDLFLIHFATTHKLSLDQDQKTINP